MVEATPIQQIYSRWGSVIRITAYCGKHAVKGFRYPCMLVKAIRDDDQAEVYHFAFTLKADGGIETIDAAIAAAPEIALSKDELKKAIPQAM